MAHSLKLRRWHLRLKPDSTIIICLALTLLLSSEALAKCEATFVNPVADVCWQCIFPVKIGGITLKRHPDLPDTTDPSDSPVCICGIRFGVTSTFWQPASIIETVKDPYCFPTIGIAIDNPKEGFLGGSSKSARGGTSGQSQGAASTFAQAHWLKFNVWAILDLFHDMPCIDRDGFDIAYITEIDPLWNDQILAFILNPEAILFANPVAQMSCVADSVAATSGLPIDPLFWCMGSWGSAYPLAGAIGSNSYVQANAGIAARMIYKMSRGLALWDSASNYCGAVISPIWIKSHFRMHEVKPVRDKTCHPIGRSGLLWSQKKNPPYKAGGNASDNFSWMLFKKTACCIYYDYD